MRLYIGNVTKDAFGVLVGGNFVDALGRVGELWVTNLGSRTEFNQRPCTQPCPSPCGKSKLYDLHDPVYIQPVSLLHAVVVYQIKHMQEN